MKEVIKDGTVNIEKRKFRYSHFKVPYGDRDGICGHVELTEINQVGLDWGLQIGIKYDGEKELKDDEKFIMTIGTVKTFNGFPKCGTLCGTVYVFKNDKLVAVQTDEGVITPENLQFKSFENEAPNYKDSLELIKKAEVIVDNMQNAQTFAGLRKIER